MYEVAQVWQAVPVYEVAQVCQAVPGYEVAQVGRLYLCMKWAR
jgi:hypothetical protein